MALDEYDLREGKRFIVGKWQVDFVVSFFSNDLERVPASQFKSDDGKDLSGICYEFFEDGNMIMTDSAENKTENGTWEQTDRYEYHYTLGAFIKIPDSSFKKNAETLSVVDGYLTFSIGFLSLGMKKISDGIVTEPPDIGDIEMSEEDLKQTAIVGKYAVYKTFAFIGDEMKLVTREELESESKKHNTPKEEYEEMLSMFNCQIEFTADHKVIEWSKIPEGVSEKEIEKALEEGEILERSGDSFCTAYRPWKCLDGKYYYDTGEQSEIMGEKVSSWIEIKEDQDGCIDFGHGLMIIKRI